MVGNAMARGANGVWTIDFGPVQPGSRVGNPYDVIAFAINVGPAMLICELTTSSWLSP